MQDSSAAVKAACDQRFGALKLLLAEKVQEVQDMQQQASAAHLLAAAKVRCWQCCLMPQQGVGWTLLRTAAAAALKQQCSDPVGPLVTCTGTIVLFERSQRTLKPCA